MLTAPVHALVLLALTASPAAAQIFATPRSFALPARPVATALVDLNGDSELDLVAALPTLNAVSVLLGSGFDFGAPTTVPVGAARPSAVATGDLDGDGAADVVTANSTDDSLSVLLGNGDGTFAAPTIVASPGGPVVIELADLDLDGALDLIVGTATSNVVRVHPGVGDGTFQAPLAWSVVGSVRDIAIGDIDGDGLLDMVAAASDAGTRLLVNQGALDFMVVAQAGSFGYITRGVDLADVDGDIDVDLLWIEDDDFERAVELAPNTGAGAFDVGSVVPTFLSPLSYSHVSFADLVGSGEPDAVAVGATLAGGPPTAQVQVRFGAAGAAWGGFESLTISGVIRDLVAADLDGDGFDDLVLADSDGSRIVVLENLYVAASVDTSLVACGHPTDITLSCDLPIVGSSWCWSIASDFPNAPFWLLGSFDQPASPWIVPGSSCNIWPNVLALSHVGAGVLNASGDASSCLMLPLDASLIGLEFVMQSRVFDPTYVGATPIPGLFDFFSNGLRMVLGSP